MCVTKKALFYPVQTRMAVQSLWASGDRPLLYLNSETTGQRDITASAKTPLQCDNSHGIRTGNI